MLVEQLLKEGPCHVRVLPHSRLFELMAVTSCGASRIFALLDTKYGSMPREQDHLVHRNALSMEEFGV